MDAKTETMTAEPVSLALLSNRNHVVGAKQIRKAFTRGAVNRVFLAKNADPAITEPLIALCQQNLIPFAWAKSMQDLGTACGIEVGAAAAAAID